MNFPTGLENLEGQESWKMKKLARGDGKFSNENLRQFNYSDSHTNGNSSFRLKMRKKHQESKRGYPWIWA